MVMIARYALIVLSVMIMALFIPMLSDMAFGDRSMKTQLFYSPVKEDFIWRDKMPKGMEADPQEKHHVQFLITDKSGQTYKRQDFEKMLPFIYYKNMELWGMLPLELKGQKFDKAAIKSSRQVIELKPENLPENTIGDEIYPLIESVPDGVRLVLPDDRFRIGERIEFVNADSNSVDEELSVKYTDALKSAGFVFPGEFVGGKSSILKPFDEGVFLKDKNGALFHLKRVRGNPLVVNTEVTPGGGVRFVKVSENKRKEFYGVLLSNTGELYMLGYDNYKLTPLPLKGYNPDTMDFKMIFNPLYRTATYSDNNLIRAVVMDDQYKEIDYMEHIMPGTQPTEMQRVVSYLLSYRVTLKGENSDFLKLSFAGFGVYSFISAVVCVLIYAAVAFRRKENFRFILADSGLILLSGVYGLIAVFLIPYEK